MLLASRESQDKTPARLTIHRLAHEPAGHPAHVLLAGGEKTQVRPAETEPNAHALSLAHHDVSSKLARGLQKAQSDGIDHDDQKRANRMHCLGQGTQGRDAAQEICIEEDTHY